MDSPVRKGRKPVDGDSFNFMNLMKASAEIGMKLYKQVKQASK